VFYLRVTLLSSFAGVLCTLLFFSARLSGMGSCKRLACIALAFKEELLALAWEACPWARPELWFQQGLEGHP